VSLSHKTVERSTDRNLPKLATNWFGGNPKYFYPPNQKWN